MAKFYKDYQPASLKGEIKTHEKVCNRRFRKTGKLTKLADLENYQMDKCST